MYLPCVSFHLFLTARNLLLFTWYEHLTAKQRTRIGYHMLFECGCHFMAIMCVPKRMGREERKDRDRGGKRMDET